MCQKSTQQPKRFEILRQVENSYKNRLPMSEEPKQVWTLLDEDKFKALGLCEGESTFHEARFHDWQWADGSFRFFGHSSRPGDVQDIVIVYEI